MEFQICNAVLLGQGECSYDRNSLFKSEVISDTDNDVRYVYMFSEDIAPEYDLR